MSAGTIHFAMPSDNRSMAGLWSLGGLSISELLKRTARETWDDDVFGQAARLAFYHFLAIFPGLLLLLIPLSRLASVGAEMRNLLTGAFRQFLPENAAALVGGVVRDLDANARGGGLLLAVAAAGAVWAGVNASWAMIVGLNIAYETEENRDWRTITAAAAALALAVFGLVFAALLTTYLLRAGVAPAATPGVLRRAAQWVAVTGILLISFALFYRFGPNLDGRKWQWSTPGAVFGAMLWVALTLLIREYFNRFRPYEEMYGRAAATAVMMIWLYVTSATVLIGAELNSEIEKASERNGDGGAQRKTRRGDTKRV